MLLQQEYFTNENPICHGRTDSMENGEVLSDWHWGYEKVHYNKVACASKHYKDVEDFVGAEVFVPGIKERDLQAVDDSAYGIDDAAGQQPSEACSGKCAENWNKCQHAKPSHSDIQNRGYPFGTVDPEAFQDNAEKGNCPDQSTEDVSQFIMKSNEAYRCVASGNHNKDHHMVHFAEPAVDLFCRINGVINSTCRIEQEHSQDKDA